MTEPEGPPATLRAAIARSPDAVRPLPPAWRRALALLPWAALLLAVVPMSWGVRADALVLGPSLLWGWSAIELAFAFLVAITALAEAIPGQLPSRRRAVVTACAAALVLLAITVATYAASPTVAPVRHESRYFWICLTRPFLLGLPALALLGSLAARGLVSRPVLAGALAGLAAGLTSDASWRLYCDVSDPAHVLAAHAGAVGALTVLGGALGALARRRRGSRPHFL